MSKVTKFCLMVLALSLARIAHGEVYVIVYSQTGFDLTEEQKSEMVEAPKKLIAKPSEHLEQAFRLGVGKAHVSDESEDARVQYPYMAIIDYAPIEISETRSVDPIVVCEGGGIPPQWVSCFDQSDYFVNLPNHVPIAVNSWTTPDQVQAVLAVVDQAQILTPKDVLVTSGDVNHILRRDVDIYGVIAPTSSDEHVTINVRRVLVSGVESFEVTDYSCK